MTNDLKMQAVVGQFEFLATSKKSDGACVIRVTNTSRYATTQIVIYESSGLDAIRRGRQVFNSLTRTWIEMLGYANKS
jgi:hypothetical protein